MYGYNHDRTNVVPNCGCVYEVSCLDHDRCNDLLPYGSSTCCLWYADLLNVGVDKFNLASLRFGMVWYVIYIYIAIYIYI